MITYTIFITENDFYHKGAAFYPIERINTVTGEPFSDGEHILYVNGAYRGDSDIGKLMHDFGCSDPDDMYFEQLADRARYYKENPEGVEYMCKMMEEMRNDAILKAKIEDIRNVMKSLKVDAEKAMDVLMIPVPDRPLYAARL